MTRMIKKQCDNCLKFFCNKSALNKHLKRKYPCKKVEKVVTEPSPSEIEKEVKLDSIDKEVKPDSIDKEKDANILEVQQPISMSEQEIRNNEIMEQIHKDIAGIKWETLDKQTFDFPYKKYGRSMILVGSSFTGKSTLGLKIMDLYFNNKDLVTVLMLDNPQAEVYNKLPHRFLTTDTFRADIVQAFHKINKKTKNRYPFAVMTDDILDMRYSHVLRSMLCSWRNSKINSIISLQDLNCISRSGKNSVSYICFRDNSDFGVIEYIMKNYLGGKNIFFKKKSLLEKQMLYKEILKDKENTIVLDNLKGQLRFVKYKI